MKRIILIINSMLLFSVIAFSQESTFDFDGKTQKKDSIIIDIKPPKVEKTKDISMERKLFRILPNGGVEEILPLEGSDGKTYYKFKPNDKFYSRYKCSSSQPSNATYKVCESYKFYPKFGGHNHNGNIPPYNDWNNNPLPSPACTPLTQVNNYSYVYFKAPEFATRAKHEIKFYGACSGVYYDIIDIKIDGLKALEPAYLDSLHGYVTYYNLIGATDYHPANHFARPQTIDLLKEIAWKYHVEFPTAEVLNINDISLIWGGKFDVNENWSGDHTYHRYGRQVDIRLWSIPVENRERFKEICCSLGVEVELHSKNGEPLTPFDTYFWENTDFNLPPWNSFTEEELDIRVPHYHLVFPKFDTEIDNPPDQTPQGCPPAKL